MSSVCVESHLEGSSTISVNNSSNRSNNTSCVGCEDCQDSDGSDSSGYKPQNVNEEPITESSQADNDNKNIATASKAMFAESMTIIPAIKGSREKHGKALKKMNVTWAEDVYDPIPSIVSHTRKKQQQQPQKSKSKDKKNGKKGSKGNSGSSSSRGGKDKKQVSPRSSKYNRDKVGWGTQMPPIVAASS